MAIRDLIGEACRYFRLALYGFRTALGCASKAGTSESNLDNGDTNGGCRESGHLNLGTYIFN